MDRHCSTYGRDEIFWLKNLKGRDYMEDLGVDIRMNLGKLGGKVWTGFI
jgi:hypothetical protein